VGKNPLTRFKLRNYLDGITLGELLAQEDVRAVAQRQDNDIAQTIHFKDTTTVGMALK
jgi:hypothetical protein